LYNIRPLEKEELKDFVDIIANAYPGLLIDTNEKKTAQLNNIIENIDKENYSQYIGAFKENSMVGCMRFFDFEMNLLTNIIKVGGLGSVAVHFLHKKEKVAREMVKNFIYHYRNKNISMSILYPFRSDFYKKMGFGFGTGKKRYSIKPSNIPYKKAKDKLKFLTVDNINILSEYYNFKVTKTNGLLKKSLLELKTTLENDDFSIIGYFENYKLMGYLIYKFNRPNSFNPFVNELVVKEILYDNSDILYSFLTFLNSQSDQIKKVVFEINDENFKYLFDNPSMELEDFTHPFNNIYSFESIGIMYRINNVELVFNELRNHNFANENIAVKLDVNDNFVIENNKSYYLNFTDGFLYLESSSLDYDVEIKIDISELASLLTCSIDIKTLNLYGKIKISDINYLNKLNNIFSTEEKPICLTYF
jgi:predicted acetyltransferase